MGYSKDPEFYPSEFQELFQAAKQQTIELEVGDVGAATNLRHQLHAYRRAMEISKRSGWTELRKIQIKMEGTKILMMNNQTLSESIANALGKNQTTEEDIDKYLAELEKQDEKANRH